jgi:hypothetical protein
MVFFIVVSLFWRCRDCQNGSDPGHPALRWIKEAAAETFKSPGEKLLLPAEPPSYRDATTPRAKVAA